MPGLGTSFGRGGATTFQQDLQNSDCVLIMGSNMAENHPVGYQWVMEARERGAEVIHVDPRFTRTSATATQWVGIRPGTDIAFLGGIVHHLVENGLYFEEYVKRYTNASAIITDEFVDTDDLEGLFSGWDPDDERYDVTKWMYEGMDVHAAAGAREGGFRPNKGEGSGNGGAGGALQHSGPPSEDPELQHPRCVFQILKRHFSRYTPEFVASTCGCSVEDFLRVCDTLARNSGRERTSAICYAVGWTQHTVGVQNIRAAAIVQQLLGNIGRPGGGILALRGHASIQGSTDIPTLYNILPGYIPMPHTERYGDLDGYVSANTSPTGWWGHFRAYFVSLMKAYFGEHATADNEWLFGRLPRIDDDNSVYWTLEQMLAGNVKGYLIAGENPAVGNANGKANRLGLAKLDWLVVRDLVEIESASFWYDSPEIESGELSTEEIGTEVFFLPAAAHTEKDGSFTNTQRLLQWHSQAVEPQDDCRSELWFYFHLGRRIKEKLAASQEPRDQLVQALRWDYPTRSAREEPDAEAVLAEINGWELPSGEPLDGYPALRDDGSTLCGCWIYCGVYRDGVNQAARKTPHWEQDSYVAPEWAWAWPANRRLLYNRASADPDGNPWSERKRYVWWDGALLDGRRRPRLLRRQRSPLRGARRRGGRGRHRRRPSVHHAGGRPQLALRPAGSRGRAPAGALRAARVAGLQPALPAARESAPPAGPGSPLRPLQPRRRRLRGRPLPVRHDDLPADRAPHGGRDEPHRAGSLRAAAGDVLRSLAGARRGGGARPRRVGHDLQRALGDRGPRARDRPDPLADARRAPRPPGGPALPLGVARADDRRLRERPPPHGARPERPHPGGQGRDLRHPARPAAARPGTHRIRRRAPRAGPRRRRRGGRRNA